MNIQEKVYNKTERQRELIDYFQVMLKAKLESSLALDKKAWDLLSVASATVSIVLTLQALVIREDIKNLEGTFLIGLASVLGFYTILLILVLLVVAPKTYQLAPAIPTKHLSFDKWEKDYLKKENEEEYLAQIIADFIGDGITDGAIQKGERNNNLKAQLLRGATLTLGLTIIALVGLTLTLVFSS